MHVTGFRKITLTFYVSALCVSLSVRGHVWFEPRATVITGCRGNLHYSAAAVQQQMMAVKMRACTHTPIPTNITHTDTHLWGTESVYLIHSSLHGTTLAAMSVLDQYYQAKFGSGLQFSHLPPNNKKEILSLRHRDQTYHSREYNPLEFTIAHNGSTCSPNTSPKLDISFI